MEDRLPTLSKACSFGNVEALRICVEEAALTSDPSLCQIPSIGPIRSAALLGILQTPHFSHQAAAVDLQWFGH
jgi:hypothetical protein